MSTRNTNSTTSVRAWARAYGLGYRQARRLRRQVGRGADQPCPSPGCLLKAHPSRPVHYAATGPFLHWCDEV